MKQENLRTVLELMLNFHTLINQLEIRSIVFLKQLFFFFFLQNAHREQIF